VNSLGFHSGNTNSQIPVTLGLRWSRLFRFLNYGGLLSVALIGFETALDV